MQEIVPGVYRITQMAINCYLYESTPGELTLIDTGSPGMSGTIVKAIQSLNYKPDQVKHILITHADIDHAGSLAKLTEITGAKVYAGKESVPYLEAGEAPPHTPPLMSAIMNPFQRGAKVNVTVHDREMLPVGDGILAIHAPGHSPDNYIYFLEKEGIVFAADVVFTITGNVTLSPRLINWNTQTLKHSARKILDLAPRYICPGHGSPVNTLTNPERIASLRRQLEGRASLVAT